MKINRQTRQDLFLAWINQILVVCDVCYKDNSIASMYDIMINYDQKIVWCPDCDGVTDEQVG